MTGLTRQHRLILWAMNLTSTTLVSATDWLTRQELPSQIEQLLMTAELQAAEELETARALCSREIRDAYGNTVTDPAEAALGGYTALILKRPMLWAERDKLVAIAVRVSRNRLTILALRAAWPELQALAATQDLAPSIKGDTAAATMRAAVRVLDPLDQQLQQLLVAA